MAQVVDIVSHGRLGAVYIILVNNMAADDLATQGARGSPAMLLT